MASVTPDVDDVLAERIGALVDARPDLDDVAALALAQSLAVACAWCSAAAGALCVGRDEKPLRHFLAHERRIRDAGARLGFTDPRELAATDELARESDDHRARRHFDETGDDLPGYHRGRPWSADGSHLPQQRPSTDDWRSR